MFNDFLFRILRNSSSFASRPSKLNMQTRLPAIHRTFSFKVASKFLSSSFSYASSMAFLDTSACTCKRETPGHYKWYENIFAKAWERGIRWRKTNTVHIIKIVSNLDKPNLLCWELDILRLLATTTTLCVISQQILKKMLYDGRSESHAETL